MSALGPFDQMSKALLHADRLRQIARGSYPPPVSVKIELTSSCNHDCHFCAYRQLIQAPAIKDMLDTERAELLVSELAQLGVRGLMFTGGGEPLLHPGISTILDRCRREKIEHGLITNGSRLDKLADEALAGLRWIRFSINAGTGEDYQRVHGTRTGSWEAIWTQVSRAAGFRPRGLTVGVSFVVTTWNMKGLREAAMLAREAGADYLHLRPAFEGPHTELEEQLDSQEIDQCLDEIAQLGELSSQGFRVYGVQRRFHQLKAPDRAYIHCRSTPLVAYVLPNGSVSPCTIVRDDSFHSGIDSPFLGNIYTASFSDLWNTARHRWLLSELSKAGCTRCHFSEYNRALELVDRDTLHESFL